LGSYTDDMIETPSIPNSERPRKPDWLRRQFASDLHIGLRARNVETPVAPELDVEIEQPTSTESTDTTDQRLEVVAQRGRSFKEKLLGLGARMFGQNPAAKTMVAAEGLRDGLAGVLRSLKPVAGENRRQAERTAGILASQERMLEILKVQANRLAQLDEPLAGTVKSALFRSSSPDSHQDFVAYHAESDKTSALNELSEQLGRQEQAVAALKARLAQLTALR
jgi:hypothetical protein